jgi:hypothetical protein
VPNYTHRNDFKKFNCAGSGKSVPCSKIMQPPIPPGTRPVAAVVEKMKSWFHWLFVVLLAAAFVLVLAANGMTLNLPGQPGWPEALLILLAMVSTITALARQLPLQNVLLAAFVIALPWAMPLIWVAAILNSRGVVRLILRPWRKIRSYGFWLIGLTAVLTMLFDLALDPFASRVKHYWLWMPTKFPLTWQGAPLVNFFSWAAVSLLMLVFVTPALINKNPARRVPDFHPLAVWLGAILLFGIASALHGMWVVVALDGTIAVLAATFAIRGGRW